MKKKITIILAIILILTLSVVFCSCSDDVVYDENYNENSHRLIMIEKGMYCASYCYYIYYDKETKVIYLLVPDGGVTVMLDENGKPLLYEGETEN